MKKKVNLPKRICSDIEKRYDNFIKDVLNVLRADSQMTKSEILALFKDKRIILSMKDRYIEMDAMKERRKGERTLTFRYKVKIK